MRTLDELDPPPWGEPEFDSHLVTTCHRLRRKPIGEFTVEDLRRMIGQGIGLRWLVPRALEALEQDPLSEGDLYPGDLLASVLRIPADFWSREPESRDRVEAVLEHLSDSREEVNDAVEVFRARPNAPLERPGAWAPVDSRGGWSAPAAQRPCS